VLDASSPGLLAGDLAACDAYRRLDTAAEELAPACLVVTADRDRMTPAKGGRALAARVRRGVCVELDDVGHMAPIEAPRELATALRRWLVHLDAAAETGADS
jgi:pimeloyl-ACP methyl ester carboxylesterase